MRAQFKVGDHVIWNSEAVAYQGREVPCRNDVSNPRHGTGRLLRVAQKPLSDRAIEGVRLLTLIRASYKASHGIYGAPRIFLDLREAGEACSKHRVECIMRVNKIMALHGYRNCWDNAVAESFFASLKKERTKKAYIQHSRDGDD